MGNKDWKNKIAYFVTVFYIDENTPKEKLYTRIRCWGYYHNEEDAERCIAENWTDIYENGYYNMAMIEPMRQGPCCAIPDKNRWFSVEWRENGYDIKEIERPERFRQICGFSYA